MYKDKGRGKNPSSLSFVVYTKKDTLEGVFETNCLERGCRLAGCKSTVPALHTHPFRHGKGERFCKELEKVRNCATFPGRCLPHL